MPQGDRSSLAAKLFDSRYALLLATLLSAFAVYPFLGSVPAVRWILNVSLLATVGAAIYAVWERRRVALAAVILALLSVVANVVRDLGVAEAEQPAFAARFIFLIFITVIIFWDILDSQRMTMNLVMGACCVYLLMGLMWSDVYLWIETVRPGAFSLLDEAGGGGSVESQLTYFSFITLTTVGYGDVSPVASTARALSALEGILAQLYLAIIIARLVGLRISHRAFESRSRQ